MAMRLVGLAGFERQCLPPGMWPGRRTTYSLSSETIISGFEQRNNRFQPQRTLDYTGLRKSLYTEWTPPRYHIVLFTHAASQGPLIDGVEDTQIGDGHALTRLVQVNVPKTRRTYCKGKDCKKHTQHKVTR